MGLEDRDYMSESKSNSNDVKVCPKTGHWIGTVNWVDCSKCDFESCKRQQFFKKLPVQAANPPDKQEYEQFYKNIPVQTRLNPPDKQELAVCLYCHEKSLWLNEVNNSFECLNSKCDNHNVPIPMISFGENKKKIEAEEKAANESISKAKVWMGNQYWDEKAKDWRDGDKPVRVHRIPTWLVIIGICIVISIAITLILNYLHPGTKFSFFIW